MMENSASETSLLSPCISTFGQFISQNRMPHALLLVQESGADLTALSTLFAAWLLCQKPTSSGACGQCRSCLLFQAKTHPDFFAFGEADTSTGIDEIRGLIQALQQTAHQSGRQVVILQGVDHYMPAVANALLKALEEPIGDVVYLLLAQRRQRIMTTISSRCVKLMIPSGEQLPTPVQEQLKQLYWKPELAAFYEPELQEWMIAHPQEALAVLYQLIKERVTELTHKRLAMSNPSQAFSLKPFLLFTDEIVSAMKQASLPGINKLLLMESIFFRWQELTALSRKTSL